MNAKRTAGIVLSALLVASAAVSVFWTPYPPLLSVDAPALPPSLHHIAGTDTLGRDIISRLMAGTRFTLACAIAATAIAAVLGTVLGSVAGYKDSAADYVIMRMTDAVSAFPSILLSLAVVGILGGGKCAVIISISIMFTPSYTRLVRVKAASLREREYIRRSRVLGARLARIYFCHIIPNVMPSLLPAVIVGLSNAILAECAMSFLGLGASPPAPSWALMMSDALQCVLTSPWYALSCGTVITIAAAAFNCLGETDTRGGKGE